MKTQGAEGLLRCGKPTQLQPQEDDPVLDVSAPCTPVPTVLANTSRGDLSSLEEEVYQRTAVIAGGSTQRW